MKRAVALIGLMGSGKTRVGRELARLLGAQWVDLDQALERRHGPIPRQFARDGEAAFRRREKALLRELLRPGRVLSTGGGVVLDPANRARLQSQICVYLQVPLRTLERRLGPRQKAGRPLLKGRELTPLLARLNRERGPFYRACAAFTVRAGTGTPLQVASRIARRLKGFSLS